MPLYFVYIMCTDYHSSCVLLSSNGGAWGMIMRACSIFLSLNSLITFLLKYYKNIPSICVNRMKMVLYSLKDCGALLSLNSLLHFLHLFIYEYSRSLYMFLHFYNSDMENTLHIYFLLNVLYQYYEYLYITSNCNGTLSMMVTLNSDGLLQTPMVCQPKSDSCN